MNGSVKRPSELVCYLKLVAGAHLAEIEKMHAEVMVYLSRHASEPAPAEAA